MRCNAAVGRSGDAGDSPTWDFGGTAQVDVSSALAGELAVASVATVVTVVMATQIAERTDAGERLNACNGC